MVVWWYADDTCEHMSYWNHFRSDVDVDVNVDRSDGVPVPIKILIENVHLQRTCVPTHRDHISLSRRASNVLRTLSVLFTSSTVFFVYFFFSFFFVIVVAASSSTLTPATLLRVCRHYGNVVRNAVRAK